MSPIALSIVLFHALASLTLLAMFTAENSLFHALPKTPRFPQRAADVPTLPATPADDSPQLARAA